MRGQLSDERDAEPLAQATAAIGPLGPPSFS